MCSLLLTRGQPFLLDAPAALTAIAALTTRAPYAQGTQFPPLARLALEELPDPPELLLHLTRSRMGRRS